jgi:hypothetical protein
MRDVPLGTLLVRAGLLPEDKLQEAFQEGLRSGKRLGDILLERCLVTENDLGRLLAGQKGLTFVELDPAAIDPTAPPLLDSEQARLHGALPIGFEGGVPIVAVADPSNDLVIENLRRALSCEPVLVVAGRDALFRAIDLAYGDPAESPAPAEMLTQVEPAVEAPAAPVAETVVPALPETPVAPEPFAPVEKPTPVVPEPVAYEPTPEPAAPVDEPVQATYPVPVTPVATQPTTNGDGLWLGEVQEAVAAPEPVDPTPATEPLQSLQFVEPEQMLSPEPVAEAPAAAPVEPEPVVSAEPPAPAQPSWIVEVRLANGERIEVGAHTDHEDALEEARDVVLQASVDGSWPFLDGRFLRPDSIISVDLVEVAP